MPIELNYQLREQMTYADPSFPILFFHDELASLPDQAGPLHWHPDFEIAMSITGILDYQIGNEHIHLHPGESIFVNRNVIHGIRQLSGDAPDPMPNIVFSGALIAPESGTVYQKYIHPLASCDTLPYIIFTRNTEWHIEINRLVQDVFHQLKMQEPCFELAVQRDLSTIFDLLFKNLDSLPISKISRIQITAQIRVQKMLSYIYDHYSEKVSLEDIAEAADISRSEAGRCFSSYMNCSPVDALIQYRLQKAQQLLRSTSLSVQEISESCGFNSLNYFSRQYRKHYGHAPSQARKTGK